MVCFLLKLPTCPIVLAYPSSFSLFFPSCPSSFPRFLFLLRSTRCWVPDGIVLYNLLKLIRFLLVFASCLPSPRDVVAPSPPIPCPELRSSWIAWILHRRDAAFSIDRIPVLSPGSSHSSGQVNPAICGLLLWCGGQGRGGKGGGIVLIWETVIRY